MASIKNRMKMFFPPSAKTVNARLDRIEQALVSSSASDSAFSAKELFYSCWANNIHSVHEKSFGPFKNSCRGKDVVVAATGPSVNYFELIKPAIYIGVNHAYRIPNIHLDYLFLQDFQKGAAFSLEEVRKLDCVKFVGQHCGAYKRTFDADAPAEIFEWPDVKKFFVNHVQGPMGNTPLMVDLEFFPLMDCFSTVFSAIDFAFYTHPKRIYLVGCDTGTYLGGHFDGRPHQTSQYNYDAMYQGYLQVKVFASVHYPDIEIISINPVRLKGLFKDQFTDSFLKAFPENDDCKRQASRK